MLFAYPIMESSVYENAVVMFVLSVNRRFSRLLSPKLLSSFFMLLWI